MGNQVRMTTGVCGPGFGETYRDGTVPLVAAPGVLDGLASHAEKPCSCRREIHGKVIEAPPRNKHDVTDNVLGVARMDTPAYEAKQVRVHRVVDIPETLFAFSRRRRSGLHILFLSGEGQVCRADSAFPGKALFADEVEREVVVGVVVDRRDDALRRSGEA
ncbi:hypothetical protein GCM10022234_14430 [Aeromicrobium panaciterrae]